MKKICRKITLSILVGFSALGVLTAQKAPNLDDYKLVFEEEFNGTELNRDNWNVELHERGWVNNELQEYVDSPENIIVKDGKLILKPVTKDKKKQIFTSGRVNTQNKHNFKYGYFECRAKVPAGKGFLPAFWMMPVVQEHYGEWPRCGELDMMEVLGHETNKCYGTLHFGNPHTQKQGTHTLESGDFSKDFHVFGCEWLPGRITWYVDGKEFYTENDWSTKGAGKTPPYPAPYDQPFYIILNLAVGGSWVGNPDKNATYIDSSTFEIDYVKVYQKASYDENVKKPEKVMNFKKADADGNFITNGKFTNNEPLDDEKDWIFMTADGGVGSATIENSEIHIVTGKPGTQEYSIQLVQPNMPILKGGKYQLTFKARAAKKRTMKVGVTAPTRGWIRYLKDTTVNLTPEMKEYTYNFSMKDDDDDSARIDFNMGKVSAKADIFITDVSLKLVGMAEKNTASYDPDKDKGLIKNSAFDGDLFGYETFFDSSVDADCETVTEGGNTFANVEINNTGDAEWKIQLMQDGVVLEKGKTYILKIKAKCDTPRSIVFAVQHVGLKDNNWDSYGSAMTVALTNEFQEFQSNKFTMKVDDPAARLSISMGAVGGKKITKTHHIQIDDVVLEEVK